MTTRPIVVHYLHSSTRIGGGNVVLLRLIEALDRRRFAPVSVIPQPGPMTDALARRGVPAHHLDLHAATRGRAAYLAALVQVSLLLQRQRGSIVHANDLVTYGVSRRAWSPAATRWVCHIHHPDFDAPSVAWALRAPPGRILTPSRHVARRLSALMPPHLAPLNERIVAVMNPIDVAFFVPAADRAGLCARLRCDARAAHLVTAGAITPHKGQDLFVRTIRALLDQGRDAYGHVIGAVQPGSEAYDAGVRALVRDLGLDSRVRFHGFAADEAVRDLFGIADVFVLPTSEEGFGLVLAEAQACATPVVSTAIAPLDEVVQHGRTGLLIERSVAALTATVGDLLDAPERRQAMGRAGREWVVRSFSRDAYCERVAGVYEDVVRLNTQTSSRPQRSA